MHSFWWSPRLLSLCAEATSKFSGSLITFSSYFLVFLSFMDFRESYVKYFLIYSGLSPSQNTQDTQDKSVCYEFMVRLTQVSFLYLIKILGGFYDLKKCKYRFNWSRFSILLFYITNLLKNLFFIDCLLNFESF